MKIRTREIVLLLVLVLVGGLYCFMTFLYNPLAENIQAHETSLADRQRARLDADSKITALSGLQAKEDGIIAEINLESSRFVSGYAEENIVNFVHNLALDSGMFVTVIDSNGVSLSDLSSMLPEDAEEQKNQIDELARSLLGAGSATAEETAPAPGADKSAGLANAAYVYSFVIEFNWASYSQIMDFLKGIEELNKMTTINDLKIELSTDEKKEAAVPGEGATPAEVPLETPEGAQEAIADTFGTIVQENLMLKGKFTVNIYGIQKLRLEGDIFPDVEIVTPAGKDDPFMLEFRIGQ